MELIFPKFGSAMWTFRDWDWSMKAPRSAACFSTVFWEISQTVLYSFLMESGMQSML